MYIYLYISSAQISHKQDEHNISYTLESRVIGGVGIIGGVGQGWKNSVEMCPKSFAIIFITCLYHRHTHYGISQRQHVFLVYIIQCNCARLYNFFFFMMNYDENGYLHYKNVSKNDCKIIIAGGGGGWNKDVLGGKKWK